MSPVIKIRLRIRSEMLEQREDYPYLKKVFWSMEVLFYKLINRTEVVHLFTYLFVVYLTTLSVARNIYSVE
jgi:hypothetical protein